MQPEAPEADGVTVADDALFLDAQDLGELGGVVGDEALSLTAGGLAKRAL